MDGPDPRGLLLKCHPDLMRVANHAWMNGVDGWFVDYGLRTIQAERQAVATGHSRTMHSRHLPDENYGGKAMAFDFACLHADGSINWSTGDPKADDGGPYGVVGNALLKAAADLGIKAQWGGQHVGAWTDGVVSHFRDNGHFQLDPSAYP